MCVTVQQYQLLQLQQQQNEQQQCLNSFQNSSLGEAVNYLSLISIFTEFPNALCRTRCPCD